MIRVKRSAVPPPAALTGRTSPGALELAANRKLAARGRFDEMSFAAYSDQTVKDALAALFHRKCAYCEASMLGQQSGDVEHYRPKGKVSLRDPVTRKLRFVQGYYWLAADWTNLLPSCADCNRPRTQEVLGQGRRVVGKANWFPIGDERRRARTPRGIRTEPRLLLDPCVDDPRKHLVFTEDGGIEAKKIRGAPSAMGQATIETCALARVELIQARAEQRLFVRFMIRTLLASLEHGRMPAQADIDDLHALLAPNAKFSAYTRHLVDTHLAPYLRQLGL